MTSLATVTARWHLPGGLVGSAVEHGWTLPAAVAGVWTVMGMLGVSPSSTTRPAAPAAVAFCVAVAAAAGSAPETPRRLTVAFSALVAVMGSTATALAAGGGTAWPLVMGLAVVAVVSLRRRAWPGAVVVAVAAGAFAAAVLSANAAGRGLVLSPPGPRAAVALVAAGIALVVVAGLGRIAAPLVVPGVLGLLAGSPVAASADVSGLGIPGSRDGATLVVAVAAVLSVTAAIVLAARSGRSARSGRMAPGVVAVAAGPLIAAAAANSSTGPAALLLAAGVSLAPSVPGKFAALPLVPGALALVHGLNSIRADFDAAHVILAVAAVLVTTVVVVDIDRHRKLDQATGNDGRPLADPSSVPALLTTIGLLAAPGALGLVSGGARDAAERTAPLLAVALMVAVGVWAVELSQLSRRATR